MGRAEIDQKQLKEIEGRFTQLSQSRLERMLASFSLPQSDSVQLLPLLFHVNHPMLPGYVDKSTPCGLPNYSPDNLIKSIAKTISRSFKYQSRAYLRYEIFGLYLMGSAGTLGQSLKSDLDLWVCIDDQMDLSSRDKLYRKTQKISEWLAVRGVELNCYLVGENDFQHRAKRDLTKESCGDTQNFLLLDEFYRTAIWLCGRKPLWWLVPPNESYQEFSQRLLADKHLSQVEWIDFGDVSAIPASEYFSASLWQLYKSIESPYKSSLKLLLLEVYARHVDETGLLSAQFKQRVYDAKKDDTVVDPYLLMLEYAESFIKDQPTRLEFLRRAFYLKSGTKIQLGQKKVVGWRYKALLELVKGWGWKQERLNYLNQRGLWQIDRVLKEREELVRELNHSYHFLSHFARLNGVADQASQNELLSLGRKLYSVFEKRPGKIEVINTGIVKDLVESTVTLYQQSDNNWHLYLGAVAKTEVKTRKAVFTADSYFKLITWCVCNQIATKDTSIQIFAKKNYLNQNYVRERLKQLLSIYRQDESLVDDTAFQNPAMTERVGLFLNTLVDPLAAEKKYGVYSVADSYDHFCWGENQTNLIEQFETFTTNSWGENVCKLYRGMEGWIEFFNDNRDIMFDLSEKVQLFCSQLPQPNRLRDRIINLLERWNYCYSNALKKHSQFRYLIGYGRQFMCVTFDPDGVSYQQFENAQSLYLSFGHATNKAFEWVLDDEIRLVDYVKRILGKKTGGNTNCYLVKVGENVFDIFIKDPAGHVFYQQEKLSSAGQLVNYFQQFFDSLSISSCFTSIEVSTFQFWFGDYFTSGDKFRFNKIQPTTSSIARDFWNVRAIACFNTDQEICFDLIFGEKEFRYQDYGELVYRKMAQLIKSKRASQIHYPIFLSNLDLSAVIQSPGLPDYFYYKREVEYKLSKAITPRKSSS